MPSSAGGKAVKYDMLLILIAPARQYSEPVTTQDNGYCLHGEVDCRRGQY